jgi:uncharacterized membrane protein
MKTSSFILFIASLTLKALDNLSTYIMVDVYGSVIERNPVARWMIDFMGLTEAMILNYCIFAAAVISLLWKSNKHKSATWVLGFACILYLAVVINNFYYLFKAGLTG